MSRPITNRIDEHDGFKFRCPTDLARTPLNARRALLIGVCTVTNLVGYLSEMHQIESDLVHIGAIQHDGAQLPRPVAEYDFAVLILPLDMLMPAHHYFHMRYSDQQAEASRFDNSVSELHRLLDHGLRWNREHGLLTFVGNMLVPQINPVGRFLPRYDLRNPRYFVEKLNEALTLSVERQKNAHLLDIDGIVSTFGKKNIQDDFVWVDSHGAFLTDWDYSEYESKRDDSSRRLEELAPLTSYYTTEIDMCYRALCEEIIQMFRAIGQYDAVKLVVIDLDDTAWRGVAAEENQPWDYLAVGWPIGFIEALMYLKRRGVLLSIISKNDAATANKTWEFAYGSFLPMNNFVSPKINWEAKPQNMEEILQATNLLAKNVLYIDDNPVEREAMQVAFPDIRVLGANPYYLRRILLWSAELQQVEISDESDRRTEMVRHQIVRDASKTRMSQTEFLATLDLKVAVSTVRDVQDPKFARMFELLNKTNQFNTTGQRWTLSEFRERFAAGLLGIVLDVTDRFTHYGAVCMALLAENDISQVVMSCRVIGLGVETAALAVIEERARARGYTAVTAAAVTTPANILSRDLFARLGYEATEAGWTKSLSAPTSMPTHICLIGSQSNEDPVIMLDEHVSPVGTAADKPPAGMRFSQLGEDSILWNHFHARPGGFYVDVGCHDPFKFSNTCLLHTALEWQGVNIDADPAAIARMQAARPHDENIHSGVGLVDEVRTFTEFHEGAVNTFDASMAENQQANFALKQVSQVRMRPLADILSETKAAVRAIDYLNIDCEGLDHEVLMSNDWARFGAEIVTVELHGLDLMNPASHPSVQFMASKGYALRAHCLVTAFFFRV